MSVMAPAYFSTGFDLDGRALVIPTVHPQGLPIRRIDPAPCTQACPAGIQVKAYVSLIAEERFAEALEVVRRRCPLPGICGRVCHHPCEAACIRGESDDPVSIRALKRFVADSERDFPLPAPPPEDKGAGRVAVIGSGPAGLTAAYDLRLAGHRVTVFEGENDPGGMLRYGITSYRLPRDILDAEIEVIQRAGVDIETGRRLGRDFDLQELASRGFKATLLAVGAQRGRQLGLPGEEGTPEIEDALAFLRRVNADERPNPGCRVAVIGGGSTAIEAARAAHRLGAESVEILYRRSSDELLAGPEEVEAARTEGIRFRFLVAPMEIAKDKRGLKGLQCQQVGLGEPDASGRRRPIAIPGTEFLVDCDRVYAAVGQSVDLDFLPNRGRTGLVDNGWLIVDPATTMTRLTSVFAAGDMVTGPDTVIEAIGAGHRSAEAIRHFLEEGRAEIREERPELNAPIEYELPDGIPVPALRRHPPITPPTKGQEFAEFEGVFSGEDAVAEARRCLRCGPCGECRTCASTCGRRHLLMQPTDGAKQLNTALLRAPAALTLSLAEHEPVEALLMPQVSPDHLHHMDTSSATKVELSPLRNIIRVDRCRGCEACVDVCSFDAIRMELNDAGGQVARIEPALCRGCKLCSGVCPTHAAVSVAYDEPWWQSQLAAVGSWRDTESPVKDSLVVLACQRRTGSIAETYTQNGRRVQIVRLRCVGELVAGQILSVLGAGASKVLVAGCSSDRCRFDEGSTLADDQIRLAKASLNEFGLDPDRIEASWSSGRAFDRLELLLGTARSGSRTVGVGSDTPRNGGRHG